MTEKLKKQKVVCATYSLWPEAGQMVGLSKGPTYAAAQKGEIPAIKIGDRWRVPKAALHRLLSMEE